MLLVTTIVTAAVILSIGHNNIQKTMAQSRNTITATPETNTSITLSPVFTENDKNASKSDCYQWYPRITSNLLRHRGSKRCELFSHWNCLASSYER